MNKRDRITILQGISLDLLADYGHDSYFMADLEEIVKAINDRIELIKKGEV